MSDVVGNFYFKLTVNGNLLGEYSNSGSESSCTEGATRTHTESGNKNKDVFVGDYNTSWYEEGSEFVSSELKISARPSSTNLFSLSWKTSGEEIFKGEAMLCDDILVGNYYSI